MLFRTLLLGLLLCAAGARAQSPDVLDSLAADPGVSQVARSYYQGKFRAADDRRTFAVVEGIGHSNRRLRPFYLYLVTKMMGSSDGALSEALGYRAKEYAEKRPDWLCDYFQGSLAAPGTLEKWAHAIANEFRISCEGKERGCIDTWYRIARGRVRAKNAAVLSRLYVAVLREGTR